MRHPRSLTLFALLAITMQAGCRLPARQGPAPRSQVECRWLSQRAVEALGRGEQGEAESLLRQAVAAWPTDAEAHRNYADCLWRRGAQEEAIRQLEEASRLVGDDAAISARLAEMYLAGGHVELARQSADRAIELDPRLPAGWAVRGRIFRTAGLLGDALADDLRALRYAPKDRDVLLEIAELYRQQNQPERALQTLQALAETYSPGEEPARVQHLMGLAYTALGRYDDAIEQLKLAAHGKPPADVLATLGEAQLLAGRTNDAMASAQKALAIQPQHRPSLALLERIQLAQRSQETIRR
jgi:tetratricopeptide (TPR) repeat protein